MDRTRAISVNASKTIMNNATPEKLFMNNAYVYASETITNGSASS